MTRTSDNASLCIVEHIHSLLGGLGFPHLGENIAQFFTLPLGSQMGSQSSLQKLQCSLVLRDLEQFHGSLLIGSMTSDLLNDVTDELGVFSKFTLPARRPWLLGVFGSLETLFQTNGQVITRTSLAGSLNLWSFLFRHVFEVFRRLKRDSTKKN